MTGRTIVREVDIQTESCLVARKYKIRLDLADLAKLEPIAKDAQLDPAAFAERYLRVETTGA